MRIQCKCGVGELNAMKVYESSPARIKVKAGCNVCPNTEILEITIGELDINTKSEILEDGCKIIQFPTDYASEEDLIS